VGVIAGKLYLSGGFDDTLTTSKPLAKLVVYDPVRDVFVRKRDMPRRSIWGVTGVIGGRLYVLTGYSGDPPFPGAFFTRSKNFYGRGDSGEVLRCGRR
jgi:Kelch motif